VFIKTNVFIEEIKQTDPPCTHTQTHVDVCARALTFTVFFKATYLIFVSSAVSLPYAVCLPGNCILTSIIGYVARRQDRDTIRYKNDNTTSSKKVGHGNTTYNMCFIYIIYSSVARDVHHYKYGDYTIFRGAKL